MNSIQPDFRFARVDLEVLRDRMLSPCDKAVYGVLCSHANAQTHSCVVRVRTIAEEVNCSERSVQASLKALIQRGTVERRERFEQGRQKASSYRLIGCDAPCYTGAESAPTAEICMDEGAKFDTPFFKEIIKKEKKTSSPSEREAEALASNKKLGMSEIYANLSGVPAIMREVMEHFFLKTGRKTILPEELSAIRALERIHTPQRIIREIAKTAERYDRNRKPLEELSLVYIYEALKHQTSKRGASNTMTQEKTAPDLYKGAYL